MQRPLPFKPLLQKRNFPSLEILFPCWPCILTCAPFLPDFSSASGTFAEIDGTLLLLMQMIILVNELKYHLCIIATCFFLSSIDQLKTLIMILIYRLCLEIHLRNYETLITILVNRLCLEIHIKKLQNYVRQGYKVTQN